VIEFSRPSSRWAPVLLAVSLFVAVLAPIGAKLYLAAGIGIFPLLLIIIAVAGPSILNKFSLGAYRWLRYLSATAAFILAACVLVGILITPLSAYIYWFESFKSGNPQGEVGTIFVLLITLFAAIIAPTVWKMGVLWPFLMLSIVVFYLLTIIVQTQAYLVVLLVLLTAASVYYMVRRAKGGSGVHNAIFAVALILVTLIGAAFVPDTSRASGDRFVSTVLHPSLRETVTRMLPRFSLLYAVPGYGVSFSESNLGERPNLVDTSIFEIEGAPGERIYFRTRVFDEYNGTAWSMSPPFVDRYFESDKPGDFLSSEEPPPGEMLTLSFTSKSFSYIPFSLNTKRIFIEGEYPPLKGGSLSTGFGLSGPFEPGTKLHYERFTRSESVPAGLTPGEKASYLQIPDDLPLALRDIAEGLGRDTLSKAEILAKIEAFLAYNYTYTLDVDEYMYDLDGPGRADFAYSFLFTESGGYCVHFATSFILLARLSGVPARYATGYLTGIPADETKAVVTGFSAHAWPEVWLEGIGWVNWEATPAANAENYTLSGDEWYFNLGIDLNAATAEQLEGLLGRNITDRDQSTDGQGSGAVPVKLLLILFGALVGAALLTIVAVRVAYPALRYIADRRGRLYHGMKRISRRLEQKGVPIPGRAGWQAWAAGVKALIGPIGSGDDRPIDDMIRILLGLTYGGDEYQPETTLYFHAFRKHVQKGLKNQNRQRGY
jgi:hypothetical protein